MNLVIHHNDADGICAGAICDYFLDGETRLHSINYGYDIPWKLIKQADVVYLVDFCLQPFSEMIKLKEMKGDNFVWIDHHKTAIEDMEESGEYFNGLQISGKAGCELTWEWFTPDQMPAIVKLIGRYDVWDLNYHADIMNIQFGLKYLNPEAGAKIFWQHLFEDVTGEYYNEVRDKGEICYQYQARMNENYCNSHSFEVTWEGLRFLAVNALNNNSQLFDSKFDHNKHDAVLMFAYTNKKWTFSMYTDKPGVDVGAIAKLYGGGGHQSAAGFQRQDIPFRLVIDSPRC